MAVGKSAKPKTTSNSKRAGLLFPVGKVGSFLRKDNYANRVSM